MSAPDSKWMICRTRDPDSLGVRRAQTRTASVPHCTEALWSGMRRTYCGSRSVGSPPLGA